MQSATDGSTRELATSQLKLAEDLIFSPQVHGRKLFYHIEAPSLGTFFRVGYQEYVFISLLTGKLTVSQALTLTARQLGTEALTQTQGLQVAQWLMENNLADFAGKETANSLSTASSAAGTNLFQRLNPFWIKLSFGSPDRILATMLPLLGWMFSPWATLLGLAVMVAGVACLATEWTQFATSAAAVLAPHNWLWLGLAWLGLKMVHELAHGLACKYYRGSVRETGVIFVLFAPMAYVDVTSCWRFPSKWQRMHVAAAGIYIELLLAALAAIWWGQTDSIVVQHLLYNVIVMASLSTLLFNANPLMKFDGYYLLADWLEIPNLATQGNQFLQQWMECIFYGSRMRSLQLAGMKLWCVRIYGIVSAVWRVLICFSLATAASILLDGAGLPLALAGMAVWFGGPMWRLMLDLVRRFHEARTGCFRAIGLGLITAAATTWLVTQVPWPGALTAPIVVEYAELAALRSRTAGFVQRVHVADGQQVLAAELLLELTNFDLAAELRELEIKLEQERVEQRIALDKRDPAAAQIALRNQQATEERLVEVRRQVEGLRIVAPVAGRVVGRNLQQKVGTYIHEGTELLAIGNERNKELLLSVGQEEMEILMPLVGQSASFRMGSRFAQAGRLQRLEPRASLELPHPALSSNVGGSLAVMQRDAGREANLQLTAPRFRGVVSLSPETSETLGAGERGYARLGLRRESIGEFVWVRFSRWLESLLTPPRV